MDPQVFVDQLDSLRPKFAELGLDPDNEMLRHQGEHSAIISRVMQTPAEVFEHCAGVAMRSGAANPQHIARLLYGADGAANPPPPAESTEPASESSADSDAAKEHKRLEALAHAAEVEHYRSIWRDSIRQRKDALRSWDEYVANCHAAFTAARLRTTTR
jgi:hypothetical protein